MSQFSVEKNYEDRAGLQAQPPRYRKGIRGLMSVLIPNGPPATFFCKVCGRSSEFFDEATVLRKYQVQYFRCGNCGFIQTERAYWLEEAYSSAIAPQDVGIMRRNQENSDVTAAVLNLLFSAMTSAVDFGAGHGIFVRLMRDRGFNFHWSDLHARNEYARGFESHEGSAYDFLTAFEVLEHLTDPLADISKLMEISENVLVSTYLVPDPVPRISDWWYYVPSTGQHVSFYTKESLQIIAAHFGRNLLSCGIFHLFTKQPQNGLLYRLATRVRLARMVNTMYRRPSLIEADFQQTTQRD